jgi:hypothetical protein
MFAMKKTTTKARAVQPGRSKKEACPICKVPFTVGVGLASHIRFKHGNAAKGQPVASNAAIKTEAAIQVVPVIDPQSHLKEALVQLEFRKGVVAQELARKDSLQQEAILIDKRIEALTTAMRAFGQESMAASG